MGFPASLMESLIREPTEGGMSHGFGDGAGGDPGVLGLPGDGGSRGGTHPGRAGGNAKLFAERTRRVVDEVLKRYGLRDVRVQI